MRDTPSNFALSVCEISSNLLQQFFSYAETRFVKDGRTHTLMHEHCVFTCLPKSLLRHEKR